MSIKKMHGLFVSFKKTNRGCASILKFETAYSPLKNRDFVYLGFSQIT
jgi:hypothetical protein